MNKILLGLVFGVVFFAGCSQTSSSYVYYDYEEPTNYSSHIGKKNYKHPTMRPYVVGGVKYYPTVVSVGDKFYGRSSWYGPNFHGKLTSNGEKYNMWAMTAAHKTLPMNTIVRVTNRNNGKSVVVRINDRGPFVATRIIDLSKAAASKIDMIGTGTAPVKLEILGFAGKRKRVIPTKRELRKSVQKKSLGNFALQIASFSNINGAIKTQEKYDNIDGYKTIIKDTTLQNGNRIFKVCLKGFRSEKEVLDYKNKKHFKGAFILRED